MLIGACCYVVGLSSSFMVLPIIGCSPPRQTPSPPHPWVTVSAPLHPAAAQPPTPNHKGEGGGRVQEHVNVPPKHAHVPDFLDTMGRRTAVLFFFFLSLLHPHPHPHSQRLVVCVTLAHARGGCTVAAMRDLLFFL